MCGIPLHGYLGHPRHIPESTERTAVPGVASGLAVTGTGGDVLFTVVALTDPETGSTGVTRTGQLSDVMKESAQIALEPSWQPGSAQGQYEPDAEAEAELETWQDARAQSPRFNGPDA
jgi:ATP-dependent Lon protease